MKEKKPMLNGLIVILAFSIVILGLILITQRSGSETADDPSENPVVETPEGTPSTGESDPQEEQPSLPAWYVDGEFELPIVGAAGYTSVRQPVFEEPDASSSAVEELSPGTPFEIRGESGDFWYVITESASGWLEHRFAFINLPDVIPSIVYNHTNSYESRFQSSFTEIPSLTGEPLTSMIAFNDRLQKEEFIMPLLYRTAKKVFKAQQLALQNGETIVMYETFRPRELQLKVNEALTELADENKEVAEGITEAPWSMTWFINTSVSNHQRGLAVDVSLAEVNELADQTVGDYQVLNVTDYTEYEMHTPLHELSSESAIFERPIASADREGWRELEINDEMTDASLRLQSYLVEAGFNPLASEWWHFNDVDALEELGTAAGKGKFFITETKNSTPEWEEVQSNLD